MPVKHSDKTGKSKKRTKITKTKVKRKSYRNNEVKANANAKGNTNHIQIRLGGMAGNNGGGKSAGLGPQPWGGSTVVVSQPAPLYQTPMGPSYKDSPLLDKVITSQQMLNESIQEQMATLRAINAQTQRVGATPLPSQEVEQMAEQQAEPKYVWDDDSNKVAEDDSLYVKEIDTMKRKIWTPLVPKYQVSTADQEDKTPAWFKSPSVQPSDPPPPALMKSASEHTVRNKQFNSPHQLPNLRPNESHTSSITEKSNTSIFNDTPSLQSARSVKPRRLEIGETAVPIDSDDENEMVEKWGLAKKKPAGRPPGVKNKPKIHASPVAYGEVVATAAPDARYRVQEDEQSFYSPSISSALKPPDERRIGVGPSDRSGIQGKYSARYLGKVEQDWTGL